MAKGCVGGYFRLRVSSYGVFFFSRRKRHTRYWRDWRSDVCSSDLLLRMERWANRWADLVIVPNESYAAITVSRGHVPAERIHVVRNAPRADIWHPVPADESLRSEERRVGKEGDVGWCQSYIK